MNPHPENVILTGDALETLKTLPDRFVQTCVTSPPYWGLRDYGIAGQVGLEVTPWVYLERMVRIFAEVRRVLRDDGTVWINIGDSYANRSEPGRGGPDRNRRAEANQPHMGIPAGMKAKDLVGIPWRLAFALRDDGWYLRQDIIWSKPNPMPESVKDRCTRAHEYIFMLSKSPRYHYDADAIKTPPKETSFQRWDQDVEAQQGSTRQPGKTNGPMKAVGGPKKVPSGWDTRKGNHDDLTGRYAREKPLPEGQDNIRAYRDKQRGHSRRHDGFNERWDGMSKEEQQSVMANKRSVWTVATKPYSEAHFATFPPELITPCILAGAPEGGVVLDPFLGSGTTAMVAKQMRRKYLGIELNPEYVRLAEKRLRFPDPML